MGAALLAVTMLAWFRYRRVAAGRGIRARLWPWLLVAFAALAGGAAASRTGTEHGLAWLNVAGPFVVNALALLALARLIRSRDLALCAAVMVFASVVAAITLTGDAAVAVQLVIYAPLLLVTCGRLAR